MPNKIIFSEENINQIIELYQSGLSCKKIGKQFNCSKQVINALLREKDIPFRDKYHAHQKYKIDETLFEKIDTQEKAYWLGMLTGDGWITDKNEFGLSLEEDDKEIVYKFREFLKSEHPILVKENRPRKDGSASISYEIRITNAKIVSDLRKYGFISNKTEYMEFPYIEDQFMANYILGLVDSDGCICLKKIKRFPGKHALSFSFIGPKEFAEKFQQVLIDRCNISKTKLEKTITPYIRVVNYGGYKNIFKIVKYIYDDYPLCFDRKRLIAINYLIDKYPNNEWLLNQLVQKN